MSLLTIVLTIIVVGVVLWAINSLVPMESRVKSILNGVVILCLVLWLLQVFGILDFLGHFRVRR